MGESSFFVQILPALGIFVGGPLLIWWFKRGRPAASGALRVSSRTALTRNSVIAVIETDGKRFLVGATDSNVSVLSELPDTPLVTEQDAPLTEMNDSTVPTGLGTEGPRTGPLDQLRVMTTRRVTRPRPPRVHHS